MVDLTKATTAKDLRFTKVLAAVSCQMLVESIQKLVVPCENYTVASRASSAEIFLERH